MKIAPAVVDIEGDLEPQRDGIQVEDNGVDFVVSREEKSHVTWRINLYVDGECNF